jgi:hypothetical protein
MTPRPRPVTVLGMHRSGTSTAARILAFAGAPLPRGAAPGRRANPANPEGFFEVPALSRCNEDLLRALGGEWSAPPPLPGGWVDDPRLAAVRPLAARLAGRHLRRIGVVWKDPRLSLTLPFWRPILAADAPTVIVVRNPVEVAESLAARNHLDLETGAALWERYVGGALAAGAGRAALVLRYDALVEDTAATVAGARAWLEDVGVPCRGAAAPAEVAAWVQPALRRNRADDRAVDDHAALTASQRALYRTVVELAGAHQHLPAPAIPPPDDRSIDLIESRRRARAPGPKRTSVTRRVRQAASGAARMVRRP